MKHFYDNYFVVRNELLRQTQKGPKILGDYEEVPGKFKNRGQQSGHFVARKNPTNSPVAKFGYEYLLKLGEVYKAFCEYVGGHLQRIFLGEHAAKIRLAITPNQEIKVLSRIFANFRNISELPTDERQRWISNSLLRFMIGVSMFALDIDFHDNNIGEDGLLRRLDFEFSLSPTDGWKFIQTMRSMRDLFTWAVHTPKHLAELIEYLEYICSYDKDKIHDILWMSINNFFNVVRNHKCKITPEEYDNFLIDSGIEHRRGMAFYDLKLACYTQKIQLVDQMQKTLQEFTMHLKIITIFEPLRTPISRYMGLRDTTIPEYKLQNVIDPNLRLEDQLDALIELIGSDYILCKSPLFKRSIYKICKIYQGDNPLITEKIERCLAKITPAPQPHFTWRDRLQQPSVTEISHRK